MKRAKRILLRTGVGVAILMCVVGTSLPAQAHADQIDQQIQSLQQQNSQSRSTISQLQAQASGYQDAISRLQSQIDQLQTQISQNQAQQVDLQTRVQALQQQLDRQRQILGELIHTMYTDGEPSTLEELATSKSLSDFVDKQTYRQAVQHKIQTLVKQITKLQTTLAEQKARVDQLVKDQQAQQAQLTATRGQQAQLLAYNQDQQTTYTQQMQVNQAKITELRAEQARLIGRYQVGGTLAGDPSHGGYPSTWNEAPKDSLLDSWGMYNRECVSYTAFKVHQDYLAGRDRHDMPYWGGIGDAKRWPENARRTGIPVDTSPTVGSIAISTAGAWGHSMYVEKVGTMNSQPAIYVSQYNTDFSGHYSEGWRYTTGLWFIHF